MTGSVSVGCWTKSKTASSAAPAVAQNDMPAIENPAGSLPVRCGLVKACGSPILLRVGSKVCNRG
jgi:hypothetical protein